MYNIALFGAGRIGQVHAVNIAGHPETTLYSVIDPYDVNANLLCEQYGAKRQSIEEAMADPQVHAICICSATDTHADLIELGAKAGKTIFCEKPIDLDSSRVHDCLDVVGQHNVPLLVGFNRRFDPHFANLKQRVVKGEIGKPATLTITSRDPEPSPAEYSKVSGGMFRDMTIHDLDMARFILGEDPIAVTAHGSCMIDEDIGKAGDIDTGVVVLTFASGATATIQNSRKSGYGYDQRIELHGQLGMLKVDNVRENLVSVTSSEGKQSAKPLHFFLERYKDAYIAEWQHFVDVLNGSQPSCSGVDGAFALKLADTAIQSMKENKTIFL